MTHFHSINDADNPRKASRITGRELRRHVSEKGSAEKPRLVLLSGEKWTRQTEGSSFRGNNLQRVQMTEHRFWLELTGSQPIKDHIYLPFPLPTLYSLLRESGGCFSQSKMISRRRNLLGKNKKNDCEIYFWAVSKPLNTAPTPPKSSKWLSKC